MPVPAGDNVSQTHGARDDEGRRRDARKRGKQTGLPTPNRSTTETPERKDGKRQRLLKKGRYGRGRDAESIPNYDIQRRDTQNQTLSGEDFNAV